MTIEKEIFRFYCQRGADQMLKVESHLARPVAVHSP